MSGNGSQVDLSRLTQGQDPYASEGAAQRVANDGSLRPKRLVRIGLHRRISLFVAVGLALCLATFGMLGLQAVNEATGYKMNERLLVAQMAAEHIDRMLQDTLHGMEGMAAAAHLDPANPQLDVSQRALLVLRESTDVPAQRLSLLDRDGKVVATVPDDSTIVGRNLKEDPYIASVYQTGKNAVSGIHDVDLDNHAIALTVPLRDGEGHVVGALTGEFDLADPGLLGFLRPVQLGVTGSVQVIDERGNVLGSSTQAGGADQLTDHQRFAQLVQHGMPTVGICHDCHITRPGSNEIQRRQDVMAFAPLGQAPLGIILRESSEEAFAPARELRWKMLGFGVLLLIGGLLLAQSTTRSVVQPIEVLTRVAQRIAKGDLASPIPVVGHSEIAVLADALDEMRARLFNSREEIERWNESLENRVLQRTRELSALLQSANTLTSTLDLDTLLAFIVGRAAETFKASNAGVLLLYDRGQDHLVVRSSVGYQAAVRRMRLLPGEGIAGKVFANGREVLCSTPAEIEVARGDMSEANRRHMEQAMAEFSGMSSCMCAPLVAKNRPIGCLFLTSPDLVAFSESDLRLLRAMADQAAVAVENAQLYEEVRRSEEVRGDLLAKLIGAQEEERRRIARELHDETSQALTALVMGLAQLRKVTPTTLEAVHDAIDDIESLAGLTLDEIHRLIYDLRPTVLDDLGLVPAIQTYLETYEQKSGIDIDLRLEGMNERLPAQIETVLFRIVQEAVTNIARHAKASSALVELRRHEGTMTALIEDDGKGFDARTLNKKSSQRGLGILGIKERVNLLGGRFNIVSRPGRGTKLSVEVPVATRDREYDPSIAS